MFSLANCPSGACHDVDKLHGDVFHREDGPGVVVRVHSWAVVWLPEDGCRRNPKHQFGMVESLEIMVWMGCLPLKKPGDSDFASIHSFL